MPITPTEANDKFLERDKFIKICYDKQCLELFKILDGLLGEYDFNKDKIFSFSPWNEYTRYLSGYWAIREDSKELFFAEEIKKTYEKLGWYVLIKIEKLGCPRLNGYINFPVLYFAKQPLKIQKRFWGLSEEVIIDEK